MKGCFIIIFVFSVCFPCLRGEEDVKIPDKNGPFLLYDEQTIAEVQYDSEGSLFYCKLYELQNVEDARLIIEALGLPLRPVPFRSMMRVIDDCRVFPGNVSCENTTSDPLIIDKTANETAEEAVISRWSPWTLRSGIFPGTKWCGMGDIASNYEDLGLHTSMDRCCRAHDHCPVKLKAFRAGFGLVNLSLYTKSHCQCDESFYNCLKESQHRMADILGNLYFNIFRAQCMKQQVPVVCTEVRQGSNGKKRCIRWKQTTGWSRMRFIDPEKKY